MAATVNCRLMLSDLQTRHRHVKNLTALHPLRHLRRQDAPTGTAMRRLMPFHEVRCWRLTQSVASVANLATTFLTGLTTQATRCRLFKPITRRRFTAISAVLGQLTPQIRILLCHARQRGFQLSNSAQSCGKEVFKGSNLVHSTTDSEKVGPALRNSDQNRKFLRQMAKETHIKTDKTRYWLGCLAVIPRLLQNPKFFVGYDPEVV